jgi:NAD+--dinitrogen-reductase ADP-D-ribosyltransferase
MLDIHTGDSLTQEHHPALPRWAHLPINRCNLPAEILGSLSFQRTPKALSLDSVNELYPDLFNQLRQKNHALERSLTFIDYMKQRFHLPSNRLQVNTNGGGGRVKANYLNLLHGWQQDVNSRDAALLKGWVESRFGLLTRYHGKSLRSAEDMAQFVSARSQVLYATNAVEAQLDLLYSYCQFELGQQYPEQQHLTLYRGINQLEQYDVLACLGSSEYIILLNNLNAFSHQPEHAAQFGRRLLKVRIPLAKILFFQELFPNELGSGNEYAVLGGLYQACLQ